MKLSLIFRNAQNRIFPVLSITPALPSKASVENWRTSRSWPWGDIIKKNRALFPQPIDKALENIWGYASNHARHRTEERKLDIHEAYLTVGTVSSILIYLIGKADVK